MNNTLETLKPWITLAGRVLIALIFVGAGWSKIGGYEGTQQYMASVGVPGALLPLVIRSVVIRSVPQSTSKKTSAVLPFSVARRPASGRTGIGGSSWPYRKSATSRPPAGKLNPADTRRSPTPTRCCRESRDGQAPR